jgi:hypothetical protein
MLSQRVLLSVDASSSVMRRIQVIMGADDQLENGYRLSLGRLARRCDRSNAPRPDAGNPFRT